MFNAGDNVYISIRIPATNETILVPGVCTTPEYLDWRPTRNGGQVRTRLVDVITYHDVSADQSRSGEAFTFYKHQPQSATFMVGRTDHVAEIDDLTDAELLAKVAESARALQTRTVGVNAAQKPVNSGRFSTPVSAIAPQAGLPAQPAARA